MDKPRKAAILNGLRMAAKLNNTTWHAAMVPREGGGDVRVSVRKYSRTSPLMWRLENRRASLATICAVIDGADYSLERGNRAVAVQESA